MDPLISLLLVLHVAPCGLCRVFRPPSFSRGYYEIDDLGNRGNRDPKAVQSEHKKEDARVSLPVDAETNSDTPQASDMSQTKDTTGYDNFDATLKQSSHSNN